MVGNIVGSLLIKSAATRGDKISCMNVSNGVAAAAVEPELSPASDGISALNVLVDPATVPFDCAGETRAVAV